MKIKKKSLIFHNVLCISQELENNQWYGLALALREFVIREDLFPTGPFFYQKELINCKNKYTVYLPINTEIKIISPNRIDFLEELKFSQGLLFRHMDIDSSIEPSHLLLESCAKENHLELVKPFINIYLDVYGDGVIDIFAPIKDI